ncbi:MAG: hypothetical protein IJU07_07165 [Synergistaceae bacterium]|nr:hypothetical protein [Synergistaceae bacterium]
MAIVKSQGSAVVTTNIGGPSNNPSLTITITPDPDPKNYQDKVFLIDTNGDVYEGSKTQIIVSTGLPEVPSTQKNNPPLRNAQIPIKGISAWRKIS